MQKDVLDELPNISRSKRRQGCTACIRSKPSIEQLRWTGHVKRMPNERLKVFYGIYITEGKTRSQCYKDNLKTVLSLSVNLKCSKVAHNTAENQSCGIVYIQTDK